MGDKMKRKIILIFTVAILGFTTVQDANAFFLQLAESGFVWCGGVALYREVYVMTDWKGNALSLFTFTVWTKGGVIIGGSPGCPECPPGKSISNNQYASTSAFVDVDIVALNNLAIRASNDVQVDVYELETGKPIVKNFDITGNNVFHQVELSVGIDKKRPYAVIVKSNNTVIAKQIFYFNNDNQIIIKGD